MSETEKKTAEGVSELPLKTNPERRNAEPTAPIAEDTKSTAPIAGDTEPTAPIAGDTEPTSPIAEGTEPTAPNVGEEVRPTAAKPRVGEAEGSSIWEIAAEDGDFSADTGDGTERCKTESAAAENGAADASQAIAAEAREFGEVVLEAVGLTKKYKRRKGGKISVLYALKDVGFSVRSGEVVGFLGPNGAGKSTAIKLVTGLASMDGGSVRILGQDVRKDRKAALKEVGGVIESPDLYLNMTAAELMRYFAGLYPDEVFSDAGGSGESVKEKKARRIEKLLRLVGLFDRKDDKIKTYSLGMKQRLGIAQALLNRPKLLLLDEPANGLDPAGIKEIRDIVKKLASEFGMAVLVSSHQLAEMEQMCDKVVVLFRGQKVAEGKLSDLMEKVSKRRVHVKTSDPKRAAELFRDRKNVTAVVEQGGILLSGDISAGDAAKELVLNGIPISGVGEDTGNLEELYFRLTEEGGAL